MTDLLLAAGGEIQIGEHPQVVFLGLTFNVDTIVGTVIAGAILIGLGLYLRAKVTAGVPGRVQLFFETVVGAVRQQVADSIGVRTGWFVIPLAVTLFIFILICNWLAVLPTDTESLHLVPPPTADLNLTLALAFAVIIWVHAAGIRARGARNYFGHFAKPYIFLLPINIIEEIAKPFSLALRLFGNLLSGTILIALISLLPAVVLWAPHAIWKLFDLFVGVIQAFIFALLTILYFSFAMESDEDVGH